MSQSAESVTNRNSMDELLPLVTPSNVASPMFAEGFEDEPPAPVTIPATLPNARAFILAGRAVITITSPSGARYTYRVSRKDADRQSRYANLGPTYFVGLLTGPNNDSDYTYMGLLDTVTGYVRLTRNSKYQLDSKPYLAIVWVLKRVWTNQPIAPVTLQHAGKCGRCGRTLTVPSSIATGFGPECAGRMGE